MTWLAPAHVFDGAALRDRMAVEVGNGRAWAVLPLDALPEGAEIQHFAGTLSPGFVDLQVNGGGGVLLNADPSPDCMAAIAATHRRFGTVAILPTLISDDPLVQARAVDAALAARGGDGLLGLHLEGPHLATARRGTHAARFLRPLDDQTVAEVERLRAAGLAVMITVAPEAATETQIARLAETGAVVSLGHSDATFAEAQSTLAAGARAFTHLFNSMSPLGSRAPGMVGAALSSEAAAGVICDGHHVAFDTLRLALRLKPEGLFLISDAMPTVGGPDRFRLYDETLTVSEGRLVNAEGRLAGAHLTLVEALRRMICEVGADPDQALRMAVTRPAELIGRPDLARIEGRRVEDLILLDTDWRLVSLPHA